MRNLKSFLLILILLFSFFGIKSQYTSNTFFLEANPLRQQWNPSLFGSDIFYLALPWVGDMQMNLGNNAYSISDFVPQDWRNQGNLFLGPYESKLAFYNQLNNKDLIAEGDLKINYLDLGMKWKKYFFTFSVKERLSSHLVLPNNLEKFILIGNDFEKELFDFTDLDFNLSHFTETAFGIASSVEKVKWGAKLKIFSGLNTIGIRNNRFELSTSIDEWALDGSGSIHTTIPSGSVKLVQIDSVTTQLQYQSGTYFKPFGLGMGIDLGFSYMPMPELEISVAALDIGFITWKKNLNNMNYNADYAFDGIQDINLLLEGVVNAYKDEMTVIETELPESYSLESNTVSYASNLSPKINLGAVYYFRDHKYSAGLLSEFWSVGNRARSKTTLALTANPKKWLNVAASYSTYNNNLNLLGLGVDVFYRNINFLLSTDYFLPSKYFSWDFKPSGTSPFTVLSLPYETNHVNLSLGISYVIPEKKQSQVCNCYTRDY